MATEHGLEMIERLSAENTKLRSILSECAFAIGNGAFVGPNCTLEFMALLPNEIKLVMKRQRSLIDTLQNPNEWRG